jgi:predicted ATPase
MNEYGRMDSWTRGFFDQTERDLGLLIKTAMEKRKQK